MKKIIKTSSKIKKYLSDSDTVLKNLTERIGDIRINLMTDYFESLINSIIGQQLSGKAAATIEKRFINITGDLNPKKIIKIPDEIIRQAGVSYSKIKYIKNLCTAINEGNINMNNFSSMENIEIIKVLTSVKGIGNWTAEMFLIFSLGREDIFSYGDGGLQRSINFLYNHKPDKKFTEKISLNWKPYRTYASLYLWEAVNRKIAV